MDIRNVSDNLAVSPQINPTDVAAIHAAGFRSIMCNRPDGEGADQPTFEEIRQQAEALEMASYYLPVTSGKVSDDNAKDFAQALTALPGPVFAYCRTGTRSITLWALSQANRLPHTDILATAKQVGYDLSGVVKRVLNGGKTPTDDVQASHQVVVIGAGAAGIAVASSILKRKPNLDIAIIEPADVHYYQPGWTLVGAGVFKPETTVRTISAVIPAGVKWIKAAVAGFIPEENAVLLDGCSVIKYEKLVVCPGLKLNWSGIQGLSETLGKHNVTSNYRFDLAPYTWDLVKNMRSGRAVFTQPPMPIKCAGAPQKAMYLSCDAWMKKGVLANIDVQFFNAGPVLFGVADYVPALMEYVEKYQAQLNFKQQLVAVDGPNKVATFKVATGDDSFEHREVEFDMLHAVPPQTAPDFIRVSPLADAAGWVDVDQTTLQHKKYPDVYSLGDVMNAPNAKTAAAARTQAPVVAENLLADMGLSNERQLYNGYGSCPLTVERGKVILAEFGYGGKILSSFPSWLLDGKRPSKLAWLLKQKILPPVYWDGMLKGREWMLKPEKAPASSNR